LIISKLKPVHVIYENELDSENKSITKKFKNIRRMWYKFKVLNILKETYSNANNINYDIVIRLRPDLCILDEQITLKTNIPNNVIYGNNDELFYGNSHTMNVISQISDNFNTLIKDKQVVNNHFLFEKFLLQNNIVSKDLNINYKLVLTLCNIIAIAGDSGTGKTTLMKYLEKLFNDYTLKLEGDRYHKWERGDKNWNKFTHLNPKANYICKFKEDVFNLKIGENIYGVDYDHSTGKFTELQEVKSSNNIILCGLHTLIDNKTNNLFNLRIFLDPDTKLKYYWKIKRDMSKRGYSKEKVIENIKKRIKDNELYIKPQQKESDIVIKFFTDDDFVYDNIDSNPNIYLNIEAKTSNILDFIAVLNDNNIKFSFKKNNSLYTSLIFYNIQKEFLKVFYKYAGQREIKNLDNINYYTIILAFVLFYNLN
jgi:uridine kinase